MGLALSHENGRGLPIESIDHAGIHVRDLDRSVAFYERFGFAKVPQNSEIENSTVTLRHPHGAAVGSLAGTRAFVQHHDMEFLDRPVAGRGQALHVKDPDDNIIELCPPR